VDQQDERRRFPRRNLEEPIQCFLDGAMGYAVSRDLSVGGLLFTPPPGLELRPRSLVAVVFERRSDPIRPIYMIGRVVRVSPPPDQRVALRWERAVTAAQAADLVAFLNLLFHLSLKVPASQPTSGLGIARSVFNFSSLYPRRAEGVPVHCPREARRPAGDCGLEATFKELEALEVQVLRGNAGEPAATVGANYVQKKRDPRQETPASRATRRPAVTGVAPRCAVEDVVDV
jgi:hypothetical protein